jgi:hypothetical protein
MAVRSGVRGAGEQVYACRFTRARARFLTPRTVRVTHVPLAETVFPPDRRWLEHVLLPQAPDGESP